MWVCVCGGGVCGGWKGMYVIPLKWKPSLQRQQSHAAHPSCDGRNSGVGVERGQGRPRTERSLAARQTAAAPARLCCYNTATWSSFHQEERSREAAARPGPQSHTALWNAPPSAPTREATVSPPGADGWRRWGAPIC